MLLQHLFSGAIVATAAAGGLLIGALAFNPAPSAQAYSFDWPGQLVITDYYGQQAYRDLTFDWGTWSGGYAWTYNASSYIGIGNPTAGYYFSQFVARKSPQILPTKWIVSGVDVPSFYVNYGSSPQYPGAPITSDGGGSFYVGFGMCKYAGHCLPVYYGWYSAQLEGTVAQNGTYGSRKQSQSPYVVY